MRGSNSLVSIIALARAGALGEAWRLFREARLDKVTDDPAVLSVRGRLLKDEARRATGSNKRRFYKHAAESYARAAELGGQSYPLINAATLSLLGGEARKAGALARSVLDRRDDEAETPYWREATRAEALMLLGRMADARHAFADAIAEAPQAYEDHASTLRQFGLILDCLGQEKTWLDEFRPPRCLHFAGPMVLPRKEEKTLRKQVEAVLKAERIGAGYGALAAGADISIAETLLECDAELHVVLPLPAPAFRRESVTRYGPRWGARFDAVLQAAASQRVVSEHAEGPLPHAIRVAAEVAMGRAAMQAETLQTEAVQLVVLTKGRPSARDPSASAWIESHWRKSGRREHVLRISSESTPGTVAAAGRETHARCAAMLRIDFPAAAANTSEKLLQEFARSLAITAPLVPPRWTGEAILLGYGSPKEAVAAIMPVVQSDNVQGVLRVAGHYGIAQRQIDPFTHDPYLAGPAARVPDDIALSTPTGAFHVSEDFAAALHALGTSSVTEYVGDLPSTGSGPLGLFAIR